MKNEENNKAVTTGQASLNEGALPASGLCQVVVHNDDFTPMEFVVSVLEKFFYLDRRKAVAIMMEAHAKGRALCGIYSKDFAESKVMQVVDYARIHEHPLMCSIVTE